MLKQRILTAAVLLPVALFGFFFLDGLAFALFVGVVVLLGAWEWARLAGLVDQLQRIFYAGFVAVLLAGLYFFPPLSLALLMLAALWWCVALLLVMSYPQSSRYWRSVPVRLLIGLLVLVPSWYALVLLKQWPQANGLILAVMVLVWAADIGAYFSGKAFGRRKLAPSVSPGKSWEGFFGGLLTCLAIAIIFGLARGWSISTFLLVLPSVALVVAVSVVGDLTESMFKRQAGLKDSSHLLPGHGGVLDRIDSLTAAVPVYALLLAVGGVTF